MSLELNPVAETILRQEAEREGVSIDELIVRTFSTAKRKAAPAAHTEEAEEAAAPKQLRGRGMLAGILSSEDFMRRKQEEIDWEDRRRR